MIATVYQTPGVYRQDSVAPVQSALRTGVPVFIGFAVAKSGVRSVPLTRTADLAALSFEPGSYLPAAVAGFFDNGGLSCLIACADAAQLDGREAALVKALAQLEALDGFDLIAMPDAMRVQSGGVIDQAAVVRLQQAMIAQCMRLGNRMALLDAFPGGVTASLLGQGANLAAGYADFVNGALYGPWLRLADNTLAPPCGHVAGVIARTDEAIGVHKAPANAEVFGVSDLEYAINDVLQAQLNPAGVNCLRAFPGRGVRIWGARTLSRDPARRYLSERRLFLTLNRWIDLNLGWAVFEPNTPSLWARIERDLDRYLDSLWRSGALAGATAADAWFVRCNPDTVSAADRDAGRLITEIGLAPTRPAEFVVVRVNLLANIPQAA